MHGLFVKNGDKTYLLGLFTNIYEAEFCCKAYTENALEMNRNVSYYVERIGDNSTTSA